MFGDEIQRVTGRKDEYHEVDEFICNGCRFDHKDITDWTIEGPSIRKIRLSTKINTIENYRKLNCY
jgi:NADH-quinone oxidoreductase subunit G